MSVRRYLSAVLILSGVVLLGIAALHYCRGHLAQVAGRRAWEQSLAATPSSTAAAPSAIESTPKENPGITAAFPTPAAPRAAARPYPYGRPVARLRIPAAEMDYVVFGGDDQATLEKGPGHVPGTELPGEETSRRNCVITAHRDSHFRRLGWLHKGHRIELETPSGEISYRVVSREIVNPDAVRVLQATKKPRLTLITCYPFNWVGAAPQRLVVVAEPVSATARRPGDVHRTGG
ncbi:MAG TPA: class D sortase [Thermoanaerobaculia bacterium]|nr:class D sortase [Thermoanaerobaculia bacterium]